MLYMHLYSFQKILNPFYAYFSSFKLYLKNCFRHLIFKLCNSITFIHIMGLEITCIGIDIQAKRKYPHYGSLHHIWDYLYRNRYTSQRKYSPINVFLLLIFIFSFLELHRNPRLKPLYNDKAKNTLLRCLWLNLKYLVTNRSSNISSLGDTLSNILQGYNVFGARKTVETGQLI